MTLSSKTNRRNPTAGNVSTPVSSRKRRDVAQWKEQIRSACLHRALESRRGRKRCLSRQSHDGQSTTLDGSEPMTTELTCPRDFLEDELRQRGVNVESPIHDVNKNHNQNRRGDVEMMEASPEEEEEGEGFTMTEDEFIELLEELENDWKIEQLEEELELEEEIIRDQVASVEGHEQALHCPLCRRHTIETTTTNLVCAGALSCPFRLAGVAMDDLRQRIESAHMAHADFCASQNLFFSNPNPSTLTASCPTCEMTMMLFG